MALRVVEAVEEPTDPVYALLASTLDQVVALIRDRVAGAADDASEAVRVDRVQQWERLRAAVAAGQASELVGFAHARVDRELAEGADPGFVGTGVVEELGLACRLAPSLAARRLSSARAWLVDLPETFAALTTGEMSERVAETVVTETRHLDARTRREVDARVSAAGIAQMGFRDAERCARRHAYEADRVAFLERGRHERRHRRVGLRPAPDTMAVLSAYLPVEQGVACLAALRAHTDTIVAAGDPDRSGQEQRTRDQIMADTLVERLTGQARAADVAVEVQIVVPLELGADPTSGRTATITGAGPLPGQLAHDIVDVSRGRKRARRAYASRSGQVVAIDRRRRRFTGPLAALVVLRDQTCRTPGCGAPIRHLDHVHPHARGGPTEGTNAQGLCERHNQVKQAHGWSASVVHGGLGPTPHTVETITPTGHRYRSRAPDPP